MHQIIGGFILGAAFGQTTRKVVWRPLLRTVIKGGIVVAREASSVTNAMREEAISLYEEAKAELEEAENGTPEEPVTHRKQRSKNSEV
jgi:uncharacterized protein (DUF697 family)